MNIQRKPFGVTKTGRNVDSILIENSSGASIEVITYGARLISCRMPDRNGKLEELLLASREIDDFEGAFMYHGATIGRYANRIADGRFTIDGREVQTAKTHEDHQLHGGPGGFHTLVWDAFPIKYEDRGSVKFSLTSPDGDQGFPGNLDVSVTVSLTELNEIMFVYEAVTDKPTYISLTNHAYWNLSGSIRETVHDHVLKLHAEAVVEVNESLIPTGRLLPIADTPFDFSEPKAVRKDIDKLTASQGYDHNLVLRKEHSTQMKTAAVMKEPKSGRVMKLETNAPGVQFYTDNYGNPPYQGFCLETGELPDAMNHENFPQPRLDPGSTYRQVTVYSFSAE